MSEITLTATNATETRILDYLAANASDALAAKINAGTKTIGGFMRYAQGQAQKLASGQSGCCVEDAVVFGWAVHYFEEDDVTENAAPQRKPVTVAGRAKPVEKPAPVSAPESPQLTLFDALFGG